MMIVVIIMVKSKGLLESVILISFYTIVGLSMFKILNKKLIVKHKLSKNVYNITEETR